MKTIIAGSRTITDYTTLQDAIAQLPWAVTEVISGTAGGADQLGEQHAHEYSLPLNQFPAQWKTYGKRAGYLRNVQMAKNADACLVLWDSQSLGSKMMMDIAQRHELELFVWCKTVIRVNDKDAYDGYRCVVHWCEYKPLQFKQATKQLSLFEES